MSVFCSGSCYISISKWITREFEEILELEEKGCGYLWKITLKENYNKNIKVHASIQSIH